MRPALLFPLLLLCCTAAAAHGQEQIAAVKTLPSAEARQAAAADTDFVYAINNTKIAKIDRRTGEQVALSTGEAEHLNSGFFWERKLYCAHSNFPRKPEKSEIMVLDPQTMALTPFHQFGEFPGSLTWAVRKDDSWWCTFAYYGADNAQTTLVRFDLQWKQQGTWTYPPDVVRELGKHSISGGIWKDGHLLVTGHDHRVIYRLRLPESGTVLKLIQILPSPFTGQGIAEDPVTGGLIGIDRAKRQVVLGELRK